MLMARPRVLGGPGGAFGRPTENSVAGSPRSNSLISSKIGSGSRGVGSGTGTGLTGRFVVFLGRDGAAGGSQRISTVAAIAFSMGIGSAARDGITMKNRTKWATRAHRPATFKPRRSTGSEM